jgi:hypothetical protein
MFAPYRRGDAQPHFSVPPAHAAPPPGSLVKRRLLVDNRDRPDPANTNPFDFVLRLTDTGVDRYENVVSVELKGLAFPKVAGEPYVVLDVRELNEQLDATNSAANRTFGVAYFDSELLTPGQIKAVKGYDFYQREALFNPPLPSLDRLTVRFLRHSGNVVTVTDTAGEAHASMLLEITTSINRS